MYRNGLSRSPGPDLVASQASNASKGTSKPNIQEARILSLILRTIFNRRIKFFHNLLKSQRKKSYNKLNALLRFEEKHLRSVFDDIRIYGHKRVQEMHQKRLNAADISRIACNFVQKAYNQRLKEGFTKMKGCQRFSKERTQYIQRTALSLSVISMRTNGKTGLKRLIENKQQKLSLSTKLQILNTIIQRLEDKVKIQTVQILISFALLEQQKQLFQAFQQKKKQLHSSESQRSHRLAAERNNLQKLKKTIDSNAVQKYQVVGVLKREKALKIGEEKYTIRNLDQEVLSLQSECQRLIKIAANVQNIKQQRRALQTVASKNKGSEHKVKQLYLTLNNEVQRSSPTCRSVSSSKFIVMVRQKFKQTLSPGSNPEINIFKNCSAYTIYANSKNRNLLNVYENVPVENLKLSTVYERASEQNQALRQLFGSIISYSLLSLAEDQQLQASLLELETQVHQMMDAESGEKEELESEAAIRDSTLSFPNKSTKSIGIERRQDFGKASTMSFRTSK